MKIKYLLLVFIMIFSLAGCDKNNDENNNVNTENNIEKEEIIAVDYTKNYEKANEEMEYNNIMLGTNRGTDYLKTVVVPWLLSSYEEFNVVDVSLSPLEDYYYDLNSLNGQSLIFNLCEAIFETEKDIPGLEKVDGKYKEKLVVLAARPSDYIVEDCTPIGIWDYNDFVKKGAYEVARDIIGKDERYSSLLNPKEKFDVVGNFEEVDLSGIKQLKNQIVKNVGYVEDNVIMVVLEDNYKYGIENNGAKDILCDYEFILYNLKTKKIIDSEKIESVIKGSAYFSNYNNIKEIIHYGEEKSYRALVNGSKIGEMEEYPAGDYGNYMSPSCKKTIYRDGKGGLVLRENGEEKHILEGYEDVNDVTQGYGYDIFSFYGEDKIIYIKYGYEFILESGIYNLTTGVMTPFENTNGDDMPIKLIDNMLYLGASDGPVLYGLGRVDLDSENYQYESLRNDYLEESSFEISPKGDRIAVISENWEKGRNQGKIIIYNLENGEKINELYIDKPYQGSYSIHFIGEDKLFLGAFDNFMINGKSYIVDLK